MLDNRCTKGLFRNSNLNIQTLSLSLSLSGYMQCILDGVFVVLSTVISEQLWQKSICALSKCLERREGEDGIDHQDRKQE